MKTILSILFLLPFSLHAEAPLGLPEVPFPANNPYTKEKAELGRILYFDKRLSSDGTVSCATCHMVADAFTDNQPVSTGIEGRKGTRNAPTVINSAYLKKLFWDGRANSLEQQANGPITNPNEMTLADNQHEAHRQCLERIKDIQGYRRLFNQAFGREEFTLGDIAAAIATFERTVLSGNSPYDRYMASDKEALTKEQLRGLQVFNKAGCANCHTPPLFGDDRFLNIGVGMEEAHPDPGRYDVTHNKNDFGAFKIPTLREIVHTYPYMHDGRFWTLEEVVEYYDKGGYPNPNLSPLMKPLHLSTEEKKALVCFLKSLNGEGWQHFKAPDTFPE